MKERLTPEFTRKLESLIREAEFAYEDGHEELRAPLDGVREHLGHWRPGFARACRQSSRYEEE